MRGSAVGKHFDKAVTKHVCAKALDQAVHEGWLVEDVNYVRARPNQETPIHCQFVSDVLSHVRLVGLSLASRCRAFVAQPLGLAPRVTHPSCSGGSPESRSIPSVMASRLKSRQGSLT